MKVLMMIGDSQDRATGCGLYRIHQPAKQLQALGHQVTVANKMDASLRRLPSGLIEVVEIPPLNYDVVVYQRPTLYTLAQSIEHVKAQGIATVVELDDDLEKVSKANIAYRAIHPMFSQHENWEHLKVGCYHADLVTVSTPALLRYARPGRGVVLPNFVPTSLTQSVRAFGWDDDRPRIGWSGTIKTHPHDLQTTRGGVADALRSGAAGLHIVGEGEGVREALDLPVEIPMTDTGWLPMKDYPDALTAIDIGIVPLEDSEFNAAKSHLKGIEFAALGIPFVASPSPEYQRLHDDHGIGLLAKNRRDWSRHLTALVNDADMRRELGEAWRAKVRETLTYESNGPLWVTAYEKAIEFAAMRGKSGLITVRR